MSLDSMSPNKEKETKIKSEANSYAIVETSGSQFWLEPNKYYDLDRINAEVDETILIDKVLLINDEKGLSIGKPYIKVATVELKILSHKRGTKIIVYKMRPKKKTRSKNGHRQELTRVMVTSISNGKAKRTSNDANKMKEPTEETSKANTKSTSKKKKDSSID